MTFSIKSKSDKQTRRVRKTKNYMSDKIIIEGGLNVSFYLHLIHLMPHNVGLVQYIFFDFVDIHKFLINSVNCFNLWYYNF
jgi:hypothetical protein